MEGRAFPLRNPLAEFMDLKQSAVSLQRSVDEIGHNPVKLVGAGYIVQVRQLPVAQD